MKHAATLFSFGLFIACTGMALAQCQPDEMASLPGQYRVRVTGNPMRPISAKDKQIETSALGQIYSMFSKAYQPKGLVVVGAGVYGIDGTGDEVLLRGATYPYYLQMGWFPFRCKDGKVDTVLKGDESGTWLYISVNMNWGVVNSGFGPFKSIAVLPRLDNGVYHFDYGVDGLKDPPPRQPGQKTVVWDYPGVKGMRWEKSRMVTYDGQLPFELVTRREYLEFAKDWLEKDIEAELAQFAKDVARRFPIRAREVQEAEMAQRVQSWREHKFSEAFIQRQIKDQLSDEQLREQAQAKAGNFSREALARVKQLLTSPDPSDLNAWAKLFQPTDAPRNFKEFLDPRVYYGHFLVKPKDGYMAGAPSKALPRIITVYAENEVPGNKVLKPAMDEALNAIDYSVLRQLLDKSRP